MVIIGSAIVFLFGILLLSIQAIPIAFGLIMIRLLHHQADRLPCCLDLLRFWLFVSILVRWLKGIPEPVEPEPIITINIYSDENDIPTIELPREHFRRLRG